MDQGKTVNDWLSDDATDSQNHDVSASSSDESQHLTLAPGSRLRPAGSALAFVPFADWEPERSYKDEPTIRYNVEWKLLVCKEQRTSGRVRARRCHIATKILETRPRAKGG